MNQQCNRLVKWGVSLRANKVSEAILVEIASPLSLLAMTQFVISPVD